VCPWLDNERDIWDRSLPGYHSDKLLIENSSCFAWDSDCALMLSDIFHSNGSGTNHIQFQMERQIKTSTCYTFPLMLSKLAGITPKALSSQLKSTKYLFWGESYYNTNLIKWDWMCQGSNWVFWITNFGVERNQRLYDLTLSLNIWGKRCSEKLSDLPKTTQKGGGSQCLTLSTGLFPPTRLCQLPRPPLMVSMITEWSQKWAQEPPPTGAEWGCSGNEETHTDSGTHTGASRLGSCQYVVLS
jgi:hypothetical protein